jgi:hypothetical protein
MMKNTKIPQYTAQVSSFEKKQREELVREIALTELQYVSPLKLIKYSFVVIAVKGPWRSY